MSISLRIGIYWSHLGFELKGWMRVVEFGRFLPQLCSKSSSLCLSLNFWMFSTRPSRFFPGSLVVHKKSHSCHCLRGFSRWRELPRLPHLHHLPQGLLQMGRTTRGPSVPAPTGPRWTILMDRVLGCNLNLSLKSQDKEPDCPCGCNTLIP